MLQSSYDVEFRGIYIPIHVYFIFCNYACTPDEASVYNVSKERYRLIEPGMHRLSI